MLATLLGPVTSLLLLSWSCLQHRLELSGCLLRSFFLDGDPLAFALLFKATGYIFLHRQFDLADDLRTFQFRSINFQGLEYYLFHFFDFLHQLFHFRNGFFHYRLFNHRSLFHLLPFNFLTCLFRASRRIDGIQIDLIEDLGAGYFRRINFQGFRHHHFRFWFHLGYFNHYRLHHRFHYWYSSFRLLLALLLEENFLFVFLLLCFRNVALRNLDLITLHLRCLIRREFQLKGTIHLFRQLRRRFQIVLRKSFAHQEVHKGILTNVELLGSGH